MTADGGVKAPYATVLIKAGGESLQYCVVILILIAECRSGGAALWKTQMVDPRILFDPGTGFAVEVVGLQAEALPGVKAVTYFARYGLLFGGGIPEPAGS